MTVYKVALSKELWPGCLFINISSCADIPLALECIHMVHYTIGLLSEEHNLNTSIEYLPAANESQSLHMIASGQADFSDYLLRLSSERLGIDGLEHAGPLFPAHNVFLFESNKNHNASLNLLSIFPMEMYILIGAFLGVVFAFGTLKNHFLRRILIRINPLIGIFVSVFFAYLSTQVVLLFNRKVTYSEPIVNFESLVDNVAAQKYRLLLEPSLLDYGIRAWAQKRSQVLHDRVVEAFKKYPPDHNIYGNGLEGVTKNLLSPSVPRWVAVISSNLIPFFRAQACGLVMVADVNEITEFDAFFMRKGLPGIKKITDVHRTLITEELARVNGITYPPKPCYRNELEVQQIYEPLELPQLQYVFALVLVIAGGGGVVLIVTARLAHVSWKQTAQKEEPELRHVVKQELLKLQRLLSNAHDDLSVVAELIETALDQFDGM